LKKQKSRRKKSRLNPIIPAIAAAVAVHLAVILFFLYEPGHSEVPNKKSSNESQLSSEEIEPPNLNIEKSQSETSRDPVYPQEAKAVTPQKLPEENVYCWTDKNGIKNFSNILPTQVGNFEVKKMPSESDAKVTKVLIEANRVLVPVILGYGGKEVSTYLLLDTGASTTMIKRKIARLLHMQSLKPGTARVADVRTVSSDLGNLDYIIVGPHKISNFEISIMDYQGAPTQHQGLLGMNFLKEVDYSVDFRRKIISWERFE
jgi:predicted aspartyl protease